MCTVSEVSAKKLNRFSQEIKKGIRFESGTHDDYGFTVSLVFEKLPPSAA